MVAKKQSHSKVNAIADNNIFGQRSVEECEMYAKKLEKEMENEKSRWKCSFTLVNFFGGSSEYRF